MKFNRGGSHRSRSPLPVRFRLPLALVFAVVTLVAPAATTAEPPPPPDDQADAVAETADQEPVLDQGWHEQVVVTATRSDRRVGDIPRHVTVINREELEVTPEYGVGDIMLRMPAINMQGDKNTLVAARLDGGLAFRGLGGTAQSRGLVLVDGFPMNDPTGGYLLWTRVPMAGVDRIEVVPGSGGVWGNLALGGTINLITTAPGNNTLGADLRVGNRDTREATLSYADLGEAWSGSMSATALDTDGFHLLPPEEIRPINVPWRKDFLTLNGKLGRSFAPERALNLTATYFDEDRVLGTPRSIDHSDELALSAAFDLVGGGGDAWQLRAYGRDVGLEESRPLANRDGTAESANGATSNPADAIGLSALWFSGGTGKHALSAGTDLQRNAVEALQDSSFVGQVPTVLTFTEGEQRLAGLFAQDVMRATPRLTVTANARLDWIETLDGRRVETNHVTGASQETLLVDSTIETALSPNLGLVYEATGHLQVRASGYSGFRAGTPAELFITNAATSKTAANPNLEPERLVGVEAGVDYAPSLRLTTHATLYWNEGKDLIERIFVGRAPVGGAVIEPCGFLPTGGQCRERRNLNEVHTYGLEIDQDVRLAAHWRLQLTGTVLDTEVTDSPADPTLVGKRVLRTPNQAGSLTAQYSNPRLLQALVRARYVGERFDDAANQAPLPDRLTVDLSMTRDLTARWQLFASVQNVFDERRLADISATTGNELEAPRLAQLGVRFRSR